MSSEKWEDVWHDLTTNKEIAQEYKKTFLLNMFQKICSKMSKDEYYKNHILTLLRQTSDTKSMVSTIILKECGYALDDDENDYMNTLFDAYRRKKNVRKNIPIEVKKKLCQEQCNRCSSCGQLLGNDWSKIHVDHIVPWVLVGDELPNNYQVLCETCNECKNSKIDFIFKKMINLG